MLLKKLALLGIDFYQSMLSPLILPRCRFYPRCSQYAVECFQRFSFLRALWYSCLRIGKCWPWHPGGADPVPFHEKSSDCQR